MEGGGGREEGEGRREGRRGGKEGGRGGEGGREGREGMEGGRGGRRRYGDTGKGERMQMLVGIFCLIAI
jgi:hypothetical protein